MQFYPCLKSDDCYRTALNVIFTQMSAKQGIKQFKQRSLTAIVKEYKQLHDMNTFVRVYPEGLIPKQKPDSLSATNLIKDKRSRRVKGIACEYGTSQRSYIKK